MRKLASYLALPISLIGNSPRLPVYHRKYSIAMLPDLHTSCRTRFKRPTNLLKDVPQISGDLLHLPTEILVEIYNRVDPLDRMCFALSCKRLLQISSLVKIRIPSVVNHMFLPPSTCEDIFLLFRRIAPRDDRGHRDKSMGLCCDCLRYRTRRKEFWNPYRRNCLNMDVVSEMWENGVRSWHVNYIFQCPECWYLEKYGNQGREKVTSGSMGMKRLAKMEKVLAKKTFVPSTTTMATTISQPQSGNAPDKKQPRSGKSRGPGRQQASRRSSRLKKNPK